MDNFGLLFAKSLGGGGGSGTDNYNELSNKPQINSITLSGNKSLANLGIQAELTFDNEPTEESTNPVTSGAVYTALATKQDTLTVDSAPTENSTNPVQSGGVYTALAGKEDTLTFDDAPTNNSDNPVKSGGIYTALGQKQDTLTFDGTYSASTNAAATVSTVTNAIGALDVTGESGISASKTISAWSETDGKVSVSTQDIAIAGTQAVLTGYTPESPAQTDSILATDTVNAAIKKLDERSRVDENNILTIYENDKSLNRLKFNGFNASNANGVEYTINADFSITANGTPSGSISYIYLYFNGVSRIIDSFCNGNYVLSGCPEGGSNSTYRLYAAAGSYAKVDYGEGVLLDDTSQTGIVVIIAIYGGYTANNLTFKPMICTKELWDISHKYEPNTDLIDNICECFGDSLTWYDGNDYTSGVYEGYPCVGYESYLRDYLGMTVNNNGISGATTPQICAAIKNKSTTALNAASHILIMGGDNDDRLSINVGTLLPVGSAFDKTTVIGALQDMVEWLITNAPQTRIVLMTEPMGWTYRDNAMERVDDVYPEAYRKVAAQYGLPLIDNWYNSGINEYNRSTYINDKYAGNTAYMYHPNNAGWRRIGSYIVKCLKNL